MERRKFVIGLGSLAAGGAAAMGSGAVSQITADRDVDLRIAGDSNAYLGLEPGPGAGSGTNKYVEEASDGTLEFKFGDQANGATGGGVNNRADTVLEEAVTITNQSDRELWIWAGFAHSTGDAVDPTSGGARSVELVANATDITYPGDEDKSTEPATSRVLGQTETTGAISLGSGNSVDVDLNFLVDGSNDPRDSDFLTVFRAEDEDPGDTTISDHEFDVNV